MKAVKAATVQRNILLFAVLAIVGTGVVVATIGITPLYTRLRGENLTAFRHTLTVRAIAADQMLTRARDIALQFTSRTRLREELTRYNRGEIDLATLTSFSNPKLLDALSLSKEAVGVTRLDRSGRAVAQAGQSAPPALFAAAKNVLGEPVFAGPVGVGGAPHIVIYAPIIDRDEAYQGVDVVLYSLASLRRVVSDRAELRRTGEIVIATPAPNGEGWNALFPLHRPLSADNDRFIPADSPLGLALGRVRHTGARGDRAMPATFEAGPESFAHTRLDGAGWPMVARMDSAELFAGLYETVVAIVVGVLVILLVSTVGLILILRPLTGRMLVATRDLNSQVEQLEEARRSLTQRTQALEHSNADLTQFAEAAAHDLSEPLRNIATHLGMIERRHADSLDEEGLDYLRFAIDSAKHLQATLRQLLAFSHASKPLAERVPVDLNTVFDTSREAFTETIASLSAEVSRGDLPVVEADAAQMTFVFRTVIDNALKYRKPDMPPRLAVGAARDDGHWHITFADNGIGLDPAYADRAFSMFGRAHPPGGESGAGMGLAIARKIVERHGGRMTIHGQPDKGATVTMILPAVDDD